MDSQRYPGDRAYRRESGSRLVCDMVGLVNQIADILIRVNAGSSLAIGGITGSSADGSNGIITGVKGRYG